MVKTFILGLLLIISLPSNGQQLSLALLKYNGGGDWYANPTALPNLANFTNSNLKTNLTTKNVEVSLTNNDIFKYPFVHATGHGRIFFTDTEAKLLRNYLEAGGFLHIDDNYGMDQYVRPEMKKVFPELNFVEVPFSHPIYQKPYVFKNGLPKIHEHDNKPPKGYGLIYKGRLVCYYSVETDLGDGWEDASVHNDNAEKRTQAFQMGANLIQYALTN